jgi:hypothetical protein
MKGQAEDVHVGVRLASTLAAGRTVRILEEADMLHAVGPVLVPLMVGTYKLLPLAKGDSLTNPLDVLQELIDIDVPSTIEVVQDLVPSVMQCWLRAAHDRGIKETILEVLDSLLVLSDKTAIALISVIYPTAVGVLQQANADFMQVEAALALLQTLTQGAAHAKQPQFELKFVLSTLPVVVNTLSSASDEAVIESGIACTIALLRCAERSKELTQALSAGSLIQELFQFVVKNLLSVRVIDDVCVSRTGELIWIIFSTFPLFSEDVLFELFIRVLARWKAATSKVLITGFTQLFASLSSRVDVLAILRLHESAKIEIRTPMESDPSLDYSNDKSIISTNRHTFKLGYQQVNVLSLALSLWCRAHYAGKFTLSNQQEAKANSLTALIKFGVLDKVAVDVRGNNTPSVFISELVSIVAQELLTLQAAADAKSTNRPTMPKFAAMDEATGKLTFDFNGDDDEDEAYLELSDILGLNVAQANITQQRNEPNPEYVALLQNAMKQYAQIAQTNSQLGNVLVRLLDQAQMNLFKQAVASC